MTGKITNKSFALSEEKNVYFYSERKNTQTMREKVPGEAENSSELLSMSE